ncbi:MAG: DUF952 domain-containing protein [Alphaproteobacteria bacterium]|nr:DUF952 domain-containing protein [Alphaproteobacteria bacterium]
MSRLLYKICPRGEWTAALAAGRFAGSAVDRADGFIHFSSVTQVRETAARHFSGQDDLVLVGVDPDLLPQGLLKWEPSRGGALFPHLYGPFEVSAAVSAEPLPWQPGAGHRFPDGFGDA